MKNIYIYILNKIFILLGNKKKDFFEIIKKIKIWKIFQIWIINLKKK